MSLAELILSPVSVSCFCQLFLSCRPSQMGAKTLFSSMLFAKKKKSKEDNNDCAPTWHLCSSHFFFFVVSLPSGAYRYYLNLPYSYFLFSSFLLFSSSILFSSFIFLVFFPPLLTISHIFSFPSLPPIFPPFLRLRGGCGTRVPTWPALLMLQHHRNVRTQHVQ